MISQQQLALQMLAQLRLLDPSISAEIGTPERKIIDTVAQSLSDSQVDLDALSAALDIDSKYGAGLDRFFRLFGFARQSATYSTGYVTLSRLTPSNVDIRIPMGTIIDAPLGDVSSVISAATVRFGTAYDAILPAGDLSVTVPIRATVAGEIGNVAANTVTILQSASTFGVTSATNEIPTKGGKDIESDNEFKIRFKNTVFRNLAGTQDQYMALAVSTAYTTKANVIGPQSRYREYIQLPPVADNASYDSNNDTVNEAGNGNAGEYTTALSSLPFAKYIYAVELPSFVSNGELGIGSFFYRQDYDFVVNNTIGTKNRGDAYRFGLTGADWSFASNVDTPTPRPNVTFKNVYTGTDADVSAITPGEVVLFEFAYMSEASRNDISKGINNAVDVFIDGGNETAATTVIPRPTNTNTFVDDPASKFHYENYRRKGQTSKRPLIGNILTPLFWEPITDLPDSIVVADDTFYKNVHYWVVEDVSSIGGTVRSRSGIEWSIGVLGVSSTDSYTPGTNPSTFTGKWIYNPTGDPVGGQPFEISGYIYDKNIVDLQSALEGSKQVTTDVLAHRAKKRYFKLDVSVMYSGGVNVSDVNAQIQNAVDVYLKSQYFGSYIQLSDLLNAIHNVQGVDNVRWSSDIPNSTATTRVYECDIDGNPLTNVTIERQRPGSNISAGYSVPRPEIQRLFLVGRPTGGTFTLSWNGNTTAPIVYNPSAAQIASALAGLAVPPSVTVAQDSRTALGVKYPISSYSITWSGNGPQPAITANVSGLTGGDFSYRNDFFLRDDELAQLPTSALSTDTVAGIIIRPRAQNTWVRGS